MTTPNARSRRQFISTVRLATAGLTIVPRHVLGRGFQAPSDRLNVAAVGGRGRSVLASMSSENVVALCDVDWTYADKGFAGLPAEIATLEQRIADNLVEVRVPASARNEGAPPTITTRPMTPLERARAIAMAARQKGGGTLVIGTKGKLLYDTYGAKPRLLPKYSVGTPPRKLARIPDELHEMNWVDAAKGKAVPSCPFAYAAALTEVMLLGIVSLRAGWSSL